MPKKMFPINRFEGGEISGANARDIPMNAFAKLTGVNCTKIGLLTNVGSDEDYTTDIGSSGVQAGYLPNDKGTNLFQFNSDHDDLSDGDGAASTPLATTYTLMVTDVADNGSDVDINVNEYNTANTGGNLAKIKDAWHNAHVDPVFHHVNGAVRVADGNFGATTQWIGYIKTVFAGNTNLNAKVDQWHILNSTLTAPSTLDISNGTSVAQANDKIMVDDEVSELVSNEGSIVVAAEFNSPPSGGTNGTWPLATAGVGSGASNYQLYCSYVYEGGQESELIRLSEAGANMWERQAVAASENLYLNVSVRCHVEGGDGTFANKRIKGFRIYWCHTTEYPSERFLLVEGDFEKGWRIGGEGFSPWTVHTTSDPTAMSMYNPTSLYDNYPILANPPLIETFETLNGYPHTDSIAAQYKTSVITNKRCYIGNIKQNDKLYPDRIIKSPVGKYDIFPESNFIDVNISDGDEIILLKEFSDRLLQFKKRVLYIINISQDFEFLENTFPNKGISHREAACDTDFGVAFVNEDSLYLFTGEEVVDLLDKEEFRMLDKSTWSNFITNSSSIGFLPKEKKLIIVSSMSNGSSNAGDAYLYDFRTRSIALASNQLTDRNLSNFINNNPVGEITDELIWASQDGSNMDFKKWNDSSQAVASGHWVLYTKDIDFNSPGNDKSVYAIHLTYKSDGDTNLQFNFCVDGDTSNVRDFSASNSKFADKISTSTCYGSSTLDTTNDGSNVLYRTAKLVPDNSSQAKKIKSFQLRITSTGAVPSSLEINDFSISYRVHKVK